MRDAFKCCFLLWTFYCHLRLNTTTKTFHNFSGGVMAGLLSRFLPSRTEQGRVHCVGSVISQRADSTLISTREFNLTHQDTCDASRRQSPPLSPARTGSAALIRADGSLHSNMTVALSTPPATINYSRPSGGSACTNLFWWSRRSGCYCCSKTKTVCRPVRLLAASTW